MGEYYTPNFDDIGEIKRRLNVLGPNDKSIHPCILDNLIGPMYCQNCLYNIDIEGNEYFDTDCLYEAMLFEALK